MGPGFRYHLLTLVGVFLALGLGMVIGTSYVRGAVADSLTRRLDQLNQRFNAEVVPLRDSRQRYAEFVRELRPILVEKRLAGKRVAIIQTGDYADVATVLRKELVFAGATITSTTVVAPTYPTKVNIALSSLLPALRATHASLPSDATSVMRILALAAYRGAPDTDVSALTDAHLIECEGDYTQPVDYVILVGGATEDNDNRAATVDIPLVKQLQSLGANVFAVEPQDAAMSYMASYRSLSITTVDNADTDIGAMALILAMTSTDVGSYGVKPTAVDGLLPQTATR